MDKTTKVYTVYAEKDDITFIMTVEKEGKKEKHTVTGFYYGEPNEKDTKTFMNDPTAEFELEE